MGRKRPYFPSLFLSILAITNCTQCSERQNKIEKKTYLILRHHAGNKASLLPVNKLHAHHTYYSSTTFVCAKEVRAHSHTQKNSSSHNQAETSAPAQLWHCLLPNNNDQYRPGDQAKHDPIVRKDTIRMTRFRSDWGFRVEMGWLQ